MWCVTKAAHCIEDNPSFGHFRICNQIQNLDSEQIASLAKPSICLCSDILCILKISERLSDIRVFEYCIGLISLIFERHGERVKPS